LFTINFNFFQSKQIWCVSETGEDKVAAVERFIAIKNDEKGGVLEVQWCHITQSSKLIDCVIKRFSNECRKTKNKTTLNALNI